LLKIKFIISVLLELLGEIKNGLSVTLWADWREKPDDAKKGLPKKRQDAPNGVQDESAPKLFYKNIPTNDLSAL